MSLTRSLSSGASSLRAHQDRLDVISNNIANANTIGYKSSRATFQDQFSMIMSHGKSPESDAGSGMGGVNPLQYGLGVKVGAVTMNMGQGTLESTNRPLDMALRGDGFFVYNLNGSEYYSRAGAISQDKDGHLVDSASGAFMQGYNIETDTDGNMVKDTSGKNVLNGKVENLQISQDIISTPNQTETVILKGNLNSQNPEGYTRSTSINIYDNQGAARSLNITFEKTANANEYNITGTIDDLALNLGATALTFNGDGTLNTPTEIQITAADLNAALGSTVFDETTPKDITVQLAEPGNINAGLRQFAGPNTAAAAEQDGYQSGDLLSMSVDAEGKIWGAFDNGQSELLGQVVVAKFTNPEGLVKEGMNFFSASPNSGLASLGTAGEIFPSTSVAGANIEQSNVDLTTEFTDMISTQRAFEAAARTVTVSDTLLGETNNLKR